MVRKLFASAAGFVLLGGYSYAHHLVIRMEEI